MKKILSLVMVSMLLMSMTLVAGAVDNALSTYTVGSLTKEDAVATEFYDLETAEPIGTKDIFFVPVNVDVLTFNGPTTGFTAGLFFVEFDSSKLVYEAGYFDMDAGVQGYKSSGILGYKNAMTKQAFSWSMGYDESVPSKVSFGFGSEYMLSGKSISSTNTLIYLPFSAVEGATGTAEIKLTSVDVSDKNSESYGSDTAYATTVAGGVDLGGEVGPAEKPETTVVKTFPKRFYADNAITTVGVITEGKDYDNATSVKAGIKSQRDEVNVLKFPSAPIASTTDEDKSFVMVTLGDITEDTVFQPTTATWAYVDLDGVEINGDPVTANATDATEVVE